jgi:peptide/nickel transport system substrate-binding protein
MPLPRYIPPALEVSVHRISTPRSARQRALVAVAIVAAIPVVLTGCAEGSPATSSDSALTSLTVGLSQNPDTLDPGQTGLVGASKVDAQIFDTLVYRFPGEDDWTPGLATDMQVNDDATVYTFTLQQGVTFHDGTPFNADAVKATFDHDVDPATASLSAVNSLGPYKETRVVDDYTAEVVFSEPYPSFYQLVSATVLSISSPTAMEKYGTDYGQHPVGTGPFVFESFTSDSEVTLTRNDDYEWGPDQYGDGPSALEDITFRVLTDPSAQNNSLSTGEIDIADGMSTQDTTTAVAGGKVVTGANGAGMPYGYLLNVEKAPTDDPLVRQAILAAVDRQGIIDTLFDGQYELATSIVTSTLPGYTDASDTYAYDPDKAASLLDEAGWKMGSDGVRSKDGKDLELTMIDIANFGFDEMSTLVQAQLGEVGFKVDLSNQAFAAVSVAYNKGDSNTASWFYWQSDPSLAKSIFMCDQVESGFNWAHYCSDDNDAAISAADVNADADSAFADVFTALNDAAIYLPIYELRANLVSDPIDGILFTPDATPLYAAVGK